MSETEQQVSQITIKCVNDNSVDVKLLPCNVITNEDVIKTNELAQIYTFPKEIVENEGEAIYLRGRKLIGSRIEIDSQQLFIANIDANNNIECERKVHELYNYEREGNQTRRVKEETNFKEYLAVINSIMK